MSTELENLLKIAEGTKKALKSNKTTSTAELEVKAFVDTSGIREGIVYVPDRIIYDFYCTWSVKPVKFKVFLKQFKKHYNTTRVIGRQCFRIHPPSINLPAYYSMYKDPRFSNSAKYTSKYVGVYPMFGYYVARYKEVGASYYIGSYAKEKEAAIAHDLFVYKTKGSSGSFNFVNYRRNYEKVLKEEKTQAQVFEAGVSSFEREVSSSEPQGTD